MIIPYKMANDEQAVAVLQARREGKTLKALAQQLGISRERVRLREFRALQLEAYIESDDPQYELSPRVVHALLNGGETDRPLTPERVRAHYHTVRELLRLPNMGRASVMEIQNWFKLHGLPPLPDWVPSMLSSAPDNAYVQRIKQLEEDNERLKEENEQLKDELTGTKK